MPVEEISKDQTSVRIALAYVLIGCVWILLSDRVVLWLDGEIGRMTLFQTYKGWFYVIATGLLLYLLIDRSVNKIKNSEIEKRQVGEKYSELVENANDIIYSLDTAGKFASINRAGENTLGYTRRELLEKSFIEIVAPENQQYVNRLLEKSLKGNPTVHEIKLRKEDGSTVLVEINNSPIYVDGELIAIQGIARDLTARRAVEIQLEESKIRNRELLETTNEGVWITDEHGVITFVNERLSEMLDYDPAEILDNYAFDFIDEESQQEAREKLEIRKTNVKENFDFKFKRFDGSDLWAIVSSKPLFENGKYIGSIAMVTDITERKLAEESLKKEQKINNATIDSLPGVFYFYNDKGKFLRWNRNFEIVTGYTGEEISEMHPLDFFEGEEKILVEERIEDALETGESYVQANFVAKNGMKTPYFFTGKQLKLDSELYLVGVGIDINKYKTLTQLT